VRDYEGKLPTKYLQDFLNFARCSREEFDQTLDRFTNRKIFKIDEQGKFIRDKNGDLIKNDYGY